MVTQGVFYWGTLPYYRVTWRKVTQWVFYLGYPALSCDVMTFGHTVSVLFGVPCLIIVWHDDVWSHSECFIWGNLPYYCVAWRLVTQWVFYLGYPALLLCDVTFGHTVSVLFEVTCLIIVWRDVWSHSECFIWGTLPYYCVTWRLVTQWVFYLGYPALLSCDVTQGHTVTKLKGEATRNSSAWTWVQSCIIVHYSPLWACVRSDNLVVCQHWQLTDSSCQWRHRWSQNGARVMFRHEFQYTSILLGNKWAINRQKKWLWAYSLLHSYWQNPWCVFSSRLL